MLVFCCWCILLCVSYIPTKVSLDLIGFVVAISSCVVSLGSSGRADVLKLCNGVFPSLRFLFVSPICFMSIGETAAFEHHMICSSAWHQRRTVAATKRLKCGSVRIYLPQSKRLYCDWCYEDLKAWKMCICGDKKCSMEFEKVDDIIARRQRRCARTQNPHGVGKNMQGKKPQAQKEKLEQQRRCERTQIHPHEVGKNMLATKLQTQKEKLQQGEEPQTQKEEVQEDEFQMQVEEQKDEVQEEEVQTQGVCAENASCLEKKQPLLEDEKRAIADFVARKEAEERATAEERAIADFVAKKKEAEEYELMMKKGMQEWFAEEGMEVTEQMAITILDEEEEEGEVIFERKRLSL